ncbi:hypothetical protein KFL_000010310 [Klebsormidium nitens]|uniref:Uncharacterized protein n=1 Tax=Klebsormidium nitens TaxID=105231 RepID=A0A0U9HI05_KLENI|nr:hypothetical protein KFL_000010310 [Klebsormidium nitens]|eukprot:GAQ77582.1 hypothetical protein KFL_000010310 [Klebsormidium nitens]
MAVRYGALTPEVLDIWIHEGSLKWGLKNNDLRGQRVKRVVVGLDRLRSLVNTDLRSTARGCLKGQDNANYFNARLRCHLANQRVEFSEAKLLVKGKEQTRVSVLVLPDGTPPLLTGAVLSPLLFLNWRARPVHTAEPSGKKAKTCKAPDQGIGALGLEAPVQAGPAGGMVAMLTGDASPLHEPPAFSPIDDPMPDSPPIAAPLDLLQTATLETAATMAFYATSAKELPGPSVDPGKPQSFGQGPEATIPILGSDPPVSISFRTSKWYTANVEVLQDPDCPQKKSVRGDHLADLSNDILLCMKGKPVGKHVVSVKERPSVDGGGEKFIEHFAEQHMGASVTHSAGDLLNGLWWGPKGPREGAKFVVDVQNVARVGASKEYGQPLGPYFKDVDAALFLPPEIMDALVVIYRMIAGDDDLLRFHPPLLGVAGDRILLYLPGFLSIAIFHCEEWMFKAYNPSLCDVLGPMLKRAEEDVSVWTFLETTDTEVLARIARDAAPIMGMSKERSSLEAFCHDKDRMLKAPRPTRKGRSKQAAASRRSVLGDVPLRVVVQRVMEIIDTNVPHAVFILGGLRVSCNHATPQHIEIFGLKHRYTIRSQRQEALLNAMDRKHVWKAREEFEAFERLVQIYIDDGRRTLELAAKDPDFYEIVEPLVAALERARLPIDTCDDFVNFSRTYLCNICGFDIQHMKSVFNLDISDPEPPEFEGGPEDPALWDFDVCFDCMETVRDLGSRRRPITILPKKVQLVVFFGPDVLQAKLSEHRRINSCHCDA